MDSILMMNARKFLVFFFMALITIFIMFSSSSSAASRFISSAVLFFLISAVIPLHLSRFSLPISQGFSRFSVKNHPTASSCCVEYQNTSKTKFQELLLYLDQRIENWRRFPVIERLKRQSRISGRLSYKEPNITLFDIYDLGLKPSLHSARIHIENWRRFPGIERLNTQSRISISGRLSYKESNIPLFDIYDLGLKPSLHSARIHIENWRRFPGIERLNTQSRLSGRLSYKEPSITLFDIYDLGLKLSLHSARIHEASRKQKQAPARLGGLESKQNPKEHIQTSKTNSANSQLKTNSCPARKPWHRSAVSAEKQLHSIREKVQQKSIIHQGTLKHPSAIPILQPKQKQTALEGNQKRDISLVKYQKAAAVAKRRQEEKEKTRIMRKESFTIELARKKEEKAKEMMELNKMDKEAAKKREEEKWKFAAKTYQKPSCLNPEPLIEETKTEKNEVKNKLLGTVKNLQQKQAIARLGDLELNSKDSKKQIQTSETDSANSQLKSNSCPARKPWNRSAVGSEKQLCSILEKVQQKPIIHQGTLKHASVIPILQPKQKQTALGNQKRDISILKYQKAAVAARRRQEEKEKARIMRKEAFTIELTRKKEEKAKEMMELNKMDKEAAKKREEEKRKFAVQTYQKPSCLNPEPLIEETKTEKNEVQNKPLETVKNLQQIQKQAIARFGDLEQIREYSKKHIQTSKTNSANSQLEANRSSSTRKLWDRSAVSSEKHLRSIRELPLVQPTQKKAALGNQKRGINSVKSLKAAEVAKRHQEENEKARIMRNEAFQIELAEKREENAREIIELKKIEKETSRKREERRFAAQTYKKVKVPKKHFKRAAITKDECFEIDDVYEHFDAPQWVDLSASDHSLFDGDAWFCRPDCNHP